MLGGGLGYAPAPLMPGTLIHEPPEAPPPATVQDPALTAAAKPRSRAWIWILIGAALFLLGGAGAAGYAYFFLWRYEPTAAKHLPSNTVAAFRVEAAEFLLFPPVRKHIWPVLEEKAKGDKAASRLALIEDETGVDLERDVREIVVATVDATGFVVLLGGPLAKGRVVSGLHAILSKEAPDAWSVEGDLLLGPHQISIGQADDGTIVIGTHKDLTEAALGTSKAHKTVALPDGGALSFAFTEPAIVGMSATAKTLTGLDTQLGASRAAGTMKLGSDPELSVTFSPRAGASPDALKGEVEGLVQDARLLLYFAPDLAGEKQALKNASVSVKGDAVVMTAAWPYDPLDKGCQRIADGLRTLFGE